MIPELEPIWKQLDETYAAIRHVLAEVADERLTWRPGTSANSVAAIVQHIARANIRYASMIDTGQPGPGIELTDNPPRGLLEQQLEASQSRAKETFERITPAELRRIRADNWGPLGMPVEGPLDSLWFALQMVRHSAYHLGQMNVYLLMWEGEALA
jgi:uncharacterized damage-inducible protein DinB